jgi:hypothetical protein
VDGAAAEAMKSSAMARAMLAGWLAVSCSGCSFVGLWIHLGTQLGAALVNKADEAARDAAVIDPNPKGTVAPYPRPVKTVCGAWLVDLVDQGKVAREDVTGCYFPDVPVGTPVGPSSLSPSPTGAKE